MEAFEIVRLIIVFVFMVIVLFRLIAKLFFKSNPMTAKFIARTAVFSAISIILYTVPFLKFSLPIFPAFLEIHLDEIPAFMAGFAYGPLSGFLVILVKTIVKLPLTGTAGVGELADFIYSSAFIIPAAIIYKKHRSVIGALVSLLIATLIQVLTSSLITSFLILDFYIFMMGFPKGAILGMCQAANPRITSLGWTFWAYVGVPFNAMKDAMVVAITFLLYKRLHRVIDKLGENH